MNDKTKILVVSTLGSGSNEERRVRDLLSGFPTEVFPFDRTRKLSMMWGFFRFLWWNRPHLVVVEGSGIAVGLPLILGRILFGQKYVVSSGDAIGPWVGIHSRFFGKLFTLYEKWLVWCCAGFIGWTPYLVGRALTFGAPRGMTAAGWAPFKRSASDLAGARERIRTQYQIPQNAIVIGIAGTMQWTSRAGFCYGYEIVSAMRNIQRKDVFALLVGDGSGRERLEKLVGPTLKDRILFTGRVPQEFVSDYLAAMDIGSLPQSVDGVGSFRYTTKISEYLDCRLPMVTGHVPMGYDLDDGWIWRLPGNAPWGSEYITAMTKLLENITTNEIAERRMAIPESPPLFDRERQISRTTSFIADILKLTPPYKQGGHTSFGTPATSPCKSTFVTPSRPRRLLSIGHSYVLGVNRRLAHEFQKQSNGKWEVSVLAPLYFQGRNDLRANHFQPESGEPIHVDAINARWTSKIHFFHYERKLREIVRGGFDLVHAWEEPYIAAGFQIARATPVDVPLVFRSAQSLNKKYPLPFRMIEKYCVQRMSGWIFSGLLVEENLLKRPGYNERPRCHTPLGFDSRTMFVDRSAGDSVLQKLGWDRSIPVIGYLGRFVTDKGLRVLMQALDELKSPWRTLLVGNGPMLNELRKWAKQHPGQVALCTDVAHENVGGYLNAMDLMVAPSLSCPHWREQFGRMIVEAFACGVPVIGSDSGEIPNVIGDAGIVVPEANPAALRQAILNLMNSPIARNEFIAQGLERAHAEYTWARIAKTTLTFFDEVTDKSTST